MAYDFKNLNEIPTQDAPTENTTVMAFESGNPRQIPAVEFGGKGLVVDLRGYVLSTAGGPTAISDIVYDTIYEALAAGQNVVFQISVDGMDTFAGPMLSSLDSGNGFFVALYSTESTPFLLQFTNGSYHTTA